MLFQNTLPAEKRKVFRKQLEEGKIIRAVGAMNPLTAMMIENKEFEAIYISGAVLSAELGLPDIGLTTLSEVAMRGHQIARVSKLPSIIDIDTGFGEPMSVARTIHHMEDAGIAACHIEDQQNPKRCGHLDNKVIVTIEEMVKKIKAAKEARRDENFTIIARTDAKSAEGMEGAITRAKAYIEAGADMIFPEALYNAQEFLEFRKAISAPLLANMTEFGKSELLSAKELQDIGYNMVIYPVTTLRTAMRAIEELLDELVKTGTQKNMLDKMQHRKDLYTLLKYKDYNNFDKDIFNFSLK